MLGSRGDGGGVGRRWSLVAVAVAVEVSVEVSVSASVSSDADEWAEGSVEAVEGRGTVGTVGAGGRGKKSGHSLPSPNRFPS